MTVVDPFSILFAQRKNDEDGRKSTLIVRSNSRYASKSDLLAAVGGRGSPQRSGSGIRGPWAMARAKSRKQCQ
jgi:hypothetical protein